MYIKFIHKDSEPCGLEKYRSCMPVWAEVFIQGFFFFLTHTANITQIISVEATVSGPRAPSTMIALKYL